MICFDDFRDQGKEILSLRRQIDEGRLTHALLLTGEEGVGKRSLASMVAAGLLCEAVKGKPCGCCASCRQVSANMHPDITVIEKGVPLSQDTAKGRLTIPVDDIREMIRICSQFSFEGKCRVIMIVDADNMTPQAQNSLLKILEEPPKDTYFILTTAHPEQLLTTVRSRCRTVRMIPHETAYIEQVLIRYGTNENKAKQAAAASGGSIGYAIRLASDDEYWQTRQQVMNAFFRNRQRSEVLSISSKWKEKKGKADILFNILEDGLHLLTSYRFQDKEIIASDFSEEWLRFARYAPMNRLIFLDDKIRDARKQISYNVNFQAVCEQLLMAFIGEIEQWVK